MVKAHRVVQILGWPLFASACGFEAMPQCLTGAAHARAAAVAGGPAEGVTSRSQERTEAWRGTQ